MNRRKVLQQRSHVLSLIMVKFLVFRRFLFPESSQVTHFGVETNESLDLKVTATSINPSERCFSVRRGGLFNEFVFLH